VINCAEKHKKQDITLIHDTFSECVTSTLCGLDSHNSSQVHELGSCLIQKYPKTQSLDLRKTFSLGHGSFDLQTDSECSMFVEQFFPSCSKYIPSCVQVGETVEKESVAVGCLFGEYPSLMIPLLTAENDLE